MTGPTDMLVIPKCAILITAKGGPTCHAAIVSRQLGVPAIVGIGNTAGVNLMTHWESRHVNISYNELEYEGGYLEGPVGGTIVHWKKNGSVVFVKKGIGNDPEDVFEH